MGNPDKSSQNVLIGFLGNIYYDTRCFNLFNSLKKIYSQVYFIGFDWLSGNFTELKGEITVRKLKKNISLFFYLRFAFLLFMQSVNKKFSVCFAEDIYSLPFLVIAGKIKKAKIIYDSRELYGYLAGLKDKFITQKLIFLIEKFFIRFVDVVIVTGEMDREFIIKQYHLSEVVVIRNLPLYHENTEPEKIRERFKIPDDNILMVYQGVILNHRGIETSLEIIRRTSNISLLILGGGEKSEYYKSLSSELGISERVHFAGKIDQRKLMSYTSSADLGLALIENISLSYYYALPNKFFEYIMAEVPVIVSKLPQMVKVTEQYQVGIVYDAEDEDIDVLVQKIYHLKNNLDVFKRNCNSAKKELNWEVEFKKLFKYIER